MLWPVTRSTSAWPNAVLGPVYMDESYRWKERHPLYRSEPPQVGELVIPFFTNSSELFSWETAREQRVTLGRGSLALKIGIPWCQAIFQTTLEMYSSAEYDCGVGGKNQSPSLALVLVQSPAVFILRRPQILLTMLTTWWNMMHGAASKSQVSLVK